MTINPDQRIDEALLAEERALLRALGEEPSQIEQAIGLFGGRNGWVNILLMLVQAGLFIAGLWAGWQFLNAATPLDAIRWGLPAAVGLIMAVVIKMALYPVIHTQRLLRELKRLELQLAAR